MPKLTYEGAAYDVAPEESVLDALLRQGVKVAHSCRAGACQTCLIRATEGNVPAVAQHGLKSTLIEQGYFLACVCRPAEDLVVCEAGGLEVEARITALERLTPTVIRARVKTQTPIDYRPGQYITLRRKDGLARSYSLASLPENETLELHIRRAPQGQMSGWLFDEAAENEAVTVRGPAGDCFYTAERPEQSLLLAGTGTGLAPLAGICKDAIRQGHQGPIHIFHGALNPDGLYLQDEMRAVAQLNPNVRYTPVVLEGGDSEGIENGALDKVISRHHPKLTGWRGFVCGDPSIVQLLKKKLFLAGMGSREIFADAFLQAGPPQ